MDQKGKWYLLYDEYDTMEPLFGNPFTTERIELQVNNEDDAIRSGQRVWQQRLELGTYQARNTTYPKSPRVVYEIDLESQ